MPFDVEVANLAKSQEALIELGPHVHAALIDVVGDVIDGGQALAVRTALGALDGREIDVVDRSITVAVDEIDEAAADAFDGRDVELHRPRRTRDRLGAELDGPGVGPARILDAKRHGAHRGAVHPGEGLGEAVGLGIDDEIDIALAIEGDILGTMPGEGAEAEALEKRAELAYVGRRVFDEFESVGAHRVVEAIRHRSVSLAGCRARPARPPIECCPALESFVCNC